MYKKNNSFLSKNLIFYFSLTCAIGCFASEASEDKIFSQENVIQDLGQKIEKVKTSQADLAWINSQISKKNYRKVAKYCKKQAALTSSLEERCYLLWIMSDCFFLCGKEEAAVEGYLQVLTHYRLYANTDVVVRILYQIACDYRNGNGTFLGLRQPQETIGILSQLHQNAPGHELAPRILLDLIKTHMSEKEYGEAIVQVYNISKKYPLSIESQEAFFLLAQCYCLMAQRHDQDGDNAMQALVLMQDFIAYYPQHRLAGEAKQAIDDLQNLLAGYLYQKALFYWEAKYNYQRKPLAARRYLYDLIRQYPNAKVVEDAKKLIVEIEASLVKKQEAEVEQEKISSAKVVEQPASSNLLPYDAKLTPAPKSSSISDSHISVDYTARQALRNRELLQKENDEVTEEEKEK